MKSPSTATSSPTTYPTGRRSIMPQRWRGGGPVSSRPGQTKRPRPAAKTRRQAGPNECWAVVPLRRSRCL
jgi:hypothetical protein